MSTIFAVENNPQKQINDYYERRYKNQDTY